MRLSSRRSHYLGVALLVLWIGFVFSSGYGDEEWVRDGIRSAAALSVPIFVMNVARLSRWSRQATLLGAFSLAVIVIGVLVWAGNDQLSSWRLSLLATVLFAASLAAALVGYGERSDDRRRSSGRLNAQ